MECKFEMIKPKSLVEVIGTELEFRKMDVDEWTVEDEINKRNGFKINKGRDYNDCPQMTFIEKYGYNKFIEFEKDNLIEIFKDRVIADLGSGILPYGYFLALQGEAKAYIGVDITMHIKNFLGLKISSAWGDLHGNKTAIPFVSLQQEMLSFLEASNRADKKYSFICSSYGNYPNDESLFSNKFFDLLCNSLPKNTDPGGGILQNFTTLDLKGYETLKNNSPDKVPYSFLKKI